MYVLYFVLYIVLRKKFIGGNEHLIWFDSLSPCYSFTPSFSLPFSFLFILLHFLLLIINLLPSRISPYFSSFAFCPETQRRRERKSNIKKKTKIKIQSNKYPEPRKIKGCGEGEKHQNFRSITDSPLITHSNIDQGVSFRASWIACLTFVSRSSDTSSRTRLATASASGDTR